jgi:signal transduction histidine kinase
MTGDGASGTGDGGGARHVERGGGCGTHSIADGAGEHHTAAALRAREAELAIRVRVNEIFLPIPDEEVYIRVLDLFLQATQSVYGVFGFIDEDGALVVPTMTRHIWDTCQVTDKRIRFPRSQWGGASWCRAIRERRTVYSNEPSTNVPPGHVPIRRHVSMAILYQGEAIGLLQVANRETDYGDAELDLLKTIADAIAPVLAARLERDRLRAQRETLVQQLEESVAALERSNSDLEQFAYVASHDLQEPLRMVGSYVQLLARRYRGKLDADADEFIGYAVDGANRARQIIDDLLTVSRVTSRGQPFELASADGAVDRALAALDLRIRETRAVITRGALPTLPVDAGQLAQVFQNLVENALKFRGAEPPRVHVAAERKGDVWEFSVRDNGIGIEPCHFERIFVIFQRLHGRGEHPGTGIGLAVCQKIVERHGGRIWVESEPGKGSVLRFTIPAQARGRKA